QFWALFYLQTVSKVDTLSSSVIVGVGLVIGTPTLILFAWLSDIIGPKTLILFGCRPAIVGGKPVILGGFLLAAIVFYPLFTWLGMVTQPGHINYPVA